MFYLKQIEMLSRVTLSKPLATIDREFITPEAIDFLTRLNIAFEDRRRKLMARRTVVQREIDMGMFPDFPESTRGIREGIWRVKAAPADLADRMVEIRVPAHDAKRVIDALNSGANVVVGDFEDSQSPSWANVIEGQRNLRDAIRAELHSLSADGKRSSVSTEIPAIMVRPRGWHMLEKHFCLDGEPISASLFDFGLYIFHNGKALADRGTGPYFYLPKIENRFEAALWNEAFGFAEEYLDLPPGSVRATVLIDDVLAAFEMDEILYELRDRSAALSCGRLNYIFSFIKKFKGHQEFVLPERGLATTGQNFLNSCTTLLVQTCHRRGAYAIGGMSAEIPLPGDTETNDRMMDRVRRDKLRDAREGHDGTIIADPGLVNVTRDAFGSVMTNTNQLANLRTDCTISAADLLRVSTGDISGADLRKNIDSAIRYIESWLCGAGAVPLHDTLEDSAGAEISRAQVWQWLRYSIRLDDGSLLTPTLFRKYFAEEVEKIRESAGPERHRRGQYDLAARIYFNLVHHQDFQQFFTTTAYQYL